MVGDEELRRQAEARVLAPAAGEPEDTLRLLHDLQVHQVELEMQNEELRRTQVELDAARARYLDLYDLAPVGYVTVGTAGIIEEANLTAAALLGVPRGALTQQPFARFILGEDQDTYYLLRRQLLESAEAQALPAGGAAAVPGREIPRESAGADGPRAPCGNPLAAAAPGREIPRESAGADGPRAPCGHPLGSAGGAAAVPGGEIPRESAGADGPRAPCCNPLAPAGGAAAVPGGEIPRESAGADGPRAPCGHPLGSAGGGLEEPARGCEVRLVRADGTVFWARLEATLAPVRSPSTGPDRGAASGYRMVLSDISERKRAEGALRESEAHYRALVESQCDMVCRWRPDSTLVFVNTAYCDFFGKTRDELLGKPWLDLVPESARAAVRRQYEEIARHPVTHEYEHQVTVADGTCRWQAWSGIPTFDASGRLLEFQSVGRDVTARKRDEDALRASESRLRYLAVELSRVEERERQRLAVCLHDEVAQALALLRLKLGALAATLGAETAQAQVEPLRDLLERTIDQTRSLVFDLSPPILYELGLAAALEWVGEKIGRDYDLAFVCRHDGGPRVLDDELNVLLFRCAREVMMNTVRHARATRLAVVLERQGGGVRVSLEDDGCGFELSSLDRRRREVGFGLFSVRERLAAVGGRCEIESAPGRGTRVTLTVSALPPK